MKRIADVRLLYYGGGREHRPKLRDGVNQALHMLWKEERWRKSKGEHTGGLECIIDMLLLHLVLHDVDAGIRESEHIPLWPYIEYYLAGKGILADKEKEQLS